MPTTATQEPPADALGFGEFLNSDSFRSLSPAEKAKKRGDLLFQRMEKNPSLKELWDTTDEQGHQEIADKWRKKLQTDYPDSFSTEGYVYTQDKKSKGLLTLLPVQVPVLDSHTEEVLTQLDPEKNPGVAEKFLASITDDKEREQAGILLRMRYGDRVPLDTPIPDSLIETRSAKPRGGIYEYPVLIPNAIRTAGTVLGTAIGAAATSETGPGSVAGASFGGAVGGAVSGSIAQYLEKNVFENRPDYSGTDLLIDTAIGAIPALPLKAAAPLLRIGARGAEGAAVSGTLYTVHTALDPNSEFSWKELAKNTGLGFAIGSGFGAAESAWLASRLRVDPETLRNVKPLELVDTLAKAKGISREEAAKLAKDAIDIGGPASPQSPRQIEGPTAPTAPRTEISPSEQAILRASERPGVSGDLPGPTPEYPRTPLDVQQERAARAAEYEKMVAADERLRQSPAGAQSLRDQLGQESLSTPVPRTPNEFRAAEIERQLSGQERLRQSPRSAGMLAQDLMQQQGGPITLQRIQAADLSPAEPFIKAVASQEGGLTGVAHRLGLSLTKEEEITALINARAESAARSARLRAAGDIDNGIMEASKGQYFQEAFDAATGQSGARDAILEANPQTVFPIDRIRAAKAATGAPQPEIPPQQAKTPPPAKALKTPRFGSETGSIDKELMRALGFAGARFGVGATIGYAQGDTPEDKLGLAVAYGLGAAALSPKGIRTVGTMAAKTKLGRMAVPEVTVGRQIIEALRVGDHAQAALAYRQAHIARRLELGLRELGPNRDAALAEVGKYLKGEVAGTQLPSQVRGPAVEMRVMIDSLSDRLVQSGMLSANLRNTVVGNMGSYLRRSFRVFSEEGWRPEQAVYDRFINEAKLAGMTEQEANDLANELLDRDAAQKFFSGGGGVGKNLSSLMHRKNLDEATRALMGEITDPIENFNKTASNLARLVETDAMQKDIARIGEQLGIFKRNSDTAGGFTAQMAKEGSEAYDNFAGLWTTPEFRDAFQRTITSGDVGPLWRGLVTANSLSKASKTLLGPISYAPNFIGSMLGPVMNGHLNPINYVKGLGHGVIAVGDEIPFIRRAGENLLVDKKAFEKEVEDMIRLGVFGESVTAGDIRRSLTESFLGKAKKTTDAVMLPFSAVYQGSDNIGKLINFYGELSRYRAAFPQMPDTELRKLAARIVRENTQTYSEILRVVKNASVVAFMPSFVNFTWEVFRNSHNIVRRANQDIRVGMETGNKELVKAGTARLGAFLTLLGVGAGAAALSKRQAGISDEEEKAIRRQVVPEWDSNSMLVWDNYDGNSVSYANQSYVFPPAVALEGAAAAMRGDSPKEAWSNFSDSLGEQFLGGSILLKPAAEAVVGRTMDTDRRIVRPEATTLESLADRGGYFAKEAFQPLIVPETEKFLKALRGEKGLYGEQYEVGDRVKRLFGMRVNKLDINARLERNAKQLASRLNDLNGSYGSQRKLNLSESDLQSKYEQFEEGRKRIFDSARQYLEDSKTLGRTEDQVITFFRDAGMSSEFILNVLDGNYVPAVKDKKTTVSDIWDSMATLPRAEQMKLIQQQPVEMRRPLMERQRDAMIENVRGVTPRDKLVKNLDPDAKARYLAGVLRSLPDEQSRRAQRAKWVKAGVLNASVMPLLEKELAGR